MPSAGESTSHVTELVVTVAFLHSSSVCRLNENVWPATTLLGRPSTLHIAATAGPGIERTFHGEPAKCRPACVSERSYRPAFMQVYCSVMQPASIFVGCSSTVSGPRSTASISPAPSLKASTTGLPNRSFARICTLVARRATHSDSPVPVALVLTGSSAAGLTCTVSGDPAMWLSPCRMLRLYAPAVVSLNMAVYSPVPRSVMRATLVGAFLSAVARQDTLKMSPPTDLRTPALSFATNRIGSSLPATSTSSCVLVSTCSAPCEL